MGIDVTGSSSLQKLASAYKTDDSQKAEKEDYLGREDFLTMLVAQLQNQDPLNPMEGSDFSAQLAQFSSLEQLINMNESIESMVTAFNERSDTDVSAFIGKEVTGTVDSIEVSGGTFSGGYYNLAQTSDVMLTIYNEEGNTVRTLYPGQQGPGSHSISWDGTDNSGNQVADGSYSYDVLANNGYGYVSTPTTVTGTVEAVSYQNGKPYLLVDGMLVDPDSLLQVKASDTDDEPAMSALDYLGKEISYSESVVAVEGGVVSGGGLTFNLSVPEDVVLQLFDASGEEVNRIEISADNTLSGENRVPWSGMDSEGTQVSNGIYSYKVTSSSGSVEISGTGEVSGIRYLNGTQYLSLADSGDLVRISSITGVN